MKFIEGNVGSGKSTFLKLLQEKGHQIILEPVNEWCNLFNKNGKNLLEEFYGNQERYAYTFHIPWEGASFSLVVAALGRAWVL